VVQHDEVHAVGRTVPPMQPRRVVGEQHLPPRQRAVLILREVLQWPAAEVASMLDMTVASVNSALQRARAQLEQVTVSSDAMNEPADADKRDLLDRFVTAFEAKDINAMVEIFTKDAVWEMPPFLGWYQGPEAISRLIDTRCPADGPGDMKLVPTRANGQYAFGLYMRYGDVYRPFNLPVLTLTPDGVSHVTAFFDERLFRTFGLPASKKYLKKIGMYNFLTNPLFFSKSIYTK